MEGLYDAIQALSTQGNAWVTCRYGFDDDEYESLKKRGRIYYLSERREKKAEEEAINKLRRGMSNCGT